MTKDEIWRGVASFGLFGYLYLLLMGLRPLMMLGLEPIWTISCFSVFSLFLVCLYLSQIHRLMKPRCLLLGVSFLPWLLQALIAYSS